MSGLGEDLDALVVGAGPAGLAAACALARSGRRVTVLEEHRLPGVPFHRHLLGCRLTDRLARRFDPVVVLDRCQVVRFYAPGGGLLGEVGETRFHSRTVDPVGLLRELARWAAESGAELRLDSQATGLVRRRGTVAGVRVRGPGGESIMGARLVVVAQGLTRQPRLLPAARPDGKPMHGVNVEFAGADGLLPGVLERHLGVNSDPRMWACTIIPLRGGRWCSASFASRADLRHALAADTLFSRRLCRAAVVRVEPFEVSVARGRTHESATANGLLAVGEAAGYHSAVTALASGALGGAAAAEALEKGDASAEALATYERTRREVLGGFPRGPRWESALPATENLARQRGYLEAVAGLDLPPAARKLLF